ncbi:MAG: ribose-5-phosphate isomerase rki1 [Cyphobasidiales sp. Tagirdzhanova-0007]|nr:MAG: ribose-5-phosphate isomerase rki1 [Cyphobasidiales sp. Tagirdzhanova-0007]
MVTSTDTPLIQPRAQSFSAGPHHVSLTAVTSTPLPPVTIQIEAAKRLAAYAAVDAYVKQEHKVIGIGSGTTVPYVVERILQQGPERNGERWFVPTGFQSKELIVKGGLNLGDVDQFPIIDVTLDGADEVDDGLNAIKGGGACHLREKVLAEAANTFVLIADSRKNSRLLGSKWKQGVPIEVAPFAWASVLNKLQKMGCTSPKLRMGKAKAGPVVTDNGNFVIDAHWDEVYMQDPAELLHRIKMYVPSIFPLFSILIDVNANSFFFNATRLTGVLEVGLFCKMAKAAFFGMEDGTVLVRNADGTQIRIESIPGVKNDEADGAI